MTDIVFGAVLVAAILSIFLIVRLLTLDRRNAEAQWARERSELLERIQRPEMRPAAPAAYEFEAPEREREPDDWANVGTIVIDPKYGLDDE